MGLQRAGSPCLHESTWRLSRRGVRCEAARVCGTDRLWILKGSTWHLALSTWPRNYCDLDKSQNGPGMAKCRVLHMDFEISAGLVNTMLKQGEKFTLLDVREPWE